MQLWTLSDYRRCREMLLSILSKKQAKDYNIWNRFEETGPSGLVYQIVGLRAANIIVRADQNGIEQFSPSSETSVRICWTVDAPLPAQLFFQVGLVRGSEAELWTLGRVWPDWSAAP